MPKKNTRNTKGRIVAAAWKLFYEQGYEETTVEDIILNPRPPRGRSIITLMVRMPCFPPFRFSLMSGTRN